ncbi:FAD-dependent oxidoreductase [Xenorhabdus innexi]|uniref:L-lactate dehydrogenase n=1 Tax=Xenorhabdus innexi TaxID=290109 RepID=A0A1N6MY04_9GAMM|nr:FAD-dependent oxidoreductase [Xenorhabdus innexi]PHM31197.1 L-lactate dehydrogenase [Xenorhabdus innexi]SIP73664.1 conserved hypothetical protein [Xenorhabdus innexi]
MMKNNKIVIVGAGFVGTTLAWYLSHHYLPNHDKREIILIDKGFSGNGVTKQSFAWLNVSGGKPDDYRKLRQQALAEWHNLDIMACQLWVKWLIIKGCIRSVCIRQSHLRH